MGESRWTSDCRGTEEMKGRREEGRSVGAFLWREQLGIRKVNQYGDKETYLREQTIRRGE